LSLQVDDLLDDHFRRGRASSPDELAGKLTTPANYRRSSNDILSLVRQRTSPPPVDGEQGAEGVRRAPPLREAPESEASVPAPARQGAHGTTPYQLGSRRGMARAAAVAEGGGRLVEIRKKFQSASYGEN
jgi:hypothetical protein